MRLLLFICCCFVAANIINAQYLFQGQVNEDFRNGQVHLSLVEDYRKSARVYLDQVFQSTTADSLGNFSFSGEGLPEGNRIYRIHVDACTPETEGNNHFLRECTTSESVLFIAGNTDTISFPGGTEMQAFCTITSNNTQADQLLYVEALKEEMIIDFVQTATPTAQAMYFKKWIKRFQEFGAATGEPLVELYAYDFYSDRKNETYEAYVSGLESNPYYTELQQRLETQYSGTSFTAQYQKELAAERNMLSTSPAVASGFPWTQVLYVFLGVLLIGLSYQGYRVLQLKKQYNPFDSLSPQERKILSAIVAGKSNKEIAADFFISVSTVKSHINSLYKKLNMSSREEILSYYKGK